MTPWRQPRKFKLDDDCEPCPPKLRPHIVVGFRRLGGADLSAVASIEAAGCPYPLNLAELDALRLRPGVTGLVAEYHDFIAGFVFYGFNRGWLELHALTVHPELRGHGVGRQFMDLLREKLERGGRSKMTATLRETNRDGLEYLKACGWRAVSLVREFYGGEDAVIMVYRA